MQMPTPSVYKTPQKPPLHKGASTTGTDRDSTNLKNFFQNLLNKNAPSTSSAAVVASAPIIASTPSTTSSSNANIDQTPTGKLKKLSLKKIINEAKLNFPLGIPNSPPNVNSPNPAESNA